MTTVTSAQPWYRSLTATQWKTVFASNLGWTFDGYETFSLILVVGVALHDLLIPAQFGQIPVYAGTVIGITLLGWGIGGVIGGVLADYIGRRRTMIFAVRDRLRAEQRHLGAVRERLWLQSRHLLDAATISLATTRQLLAAYDPARRLAQGWSIATRADGSTLRSLADVEVGEELTLRVSDGRLGTVITSKNGDSA